MISTDEYGNANDKDRIALLLVNMVEQSVITYALEFKLLMLSLVVQCVSMHWNLNCIC